MSETPGRSSTSRSKTDDVTLPHVGKELQTENLILTDSLKLTSTIDNYKSGQEITRDLIEAEEAHENEKKHAEALGMDPNEASSYFAHLFDDGNLAGSQLMALSQTVDRARVEKWLGSASDIGSQEKVEPFDIDDWKPRLLVDLLNSLSAIADDDYHCKHRRRWQEICRAQ